MQSKLMKYRTWLIAPALVLTLNACSSSDSDFDFEASVAAEAESAELANPAQALFNPDPVSPQLPFPNNLLFVRNPADPRPEDGLLRIPIAPSADQTLANPQVALNQQNGFSTTSPITTAVSEALDPATLILGDTVRVFEVTNPTEPAALGGLLRSAVNGSVGEIDNPLLMDVRAIGNQLVLSPTVPLKPSTSYMVVLTNGILDMQGDPLQGSTVYRLLQGSEPLTNPSLEALRFVVGSHSQLLNAALNVDPANVALSWVFTTQSTRDVLQAVRDNSAASTLLLAATGVSTDNEAIGGRGRANLLVGTIDLPYYLTAVGNDGNPLPALNGFWQNAAGLAPGSTTDGIPDFAPVATEMVRVPVLMSVPNETSAGGGQMPPNGWPVTIFQHGITGDRTNMLGIADALADVGRVVIAIDMPLHGLGDPSNPFHVANNPFNSPDNPINPSERTFGIDVLTVDATTGAQLPGPDSLPDPSGVHFFNLTNLANTRDNVRQSVADLFVLSASVSSAQVDGITLDASNMNFVGHSLGAIVGTTMLSYENSFQTATLGMPGGGLAQLLANSERFGPVISLGLASAGITAGSAEFNQFLVAAQTVIDSGDPINHASTVVANGDTRIHLIEVIGDAVIPNFVSTAPLSGTDPLIRLLGLPTVNTMVMDSNAAVRFTIGDHSSLLRPATDALAATVEMQTQMAGFAFSRGTALPVSNAEILVAPVEQ